MVHLRHMAKETTLREVGEMLTHVVEHMATKDDVARIDTRIDDVKREMISLRPTDCTPRKNAKILVDWDLSLPCRYNRNDVDITRHRGVEQCAPRAWW